MNVLFLTRVIFIFTSYCIFPYQGSGEGMPGLGGQCCVGIRWVNSVIRTALAANREGNK